jgi:hypothetical protein
VFKMHELLNHLIISEMVSFHWELHISLIRLELSVTLRWINSVMLVKNTGDPCIPFHAVHAMFCFTYY